MSSLSIDTVRGGGLEPPLSGPKPDVLPIERSPNAALRLGVRTGFRQDFLICLLCGYPALLHGIARQEAP